MLLMEKDNELFLFSDYMLGWNINKGFKLLAHVPANRYIRVFRGEHNLDRYIEQQRRLLDQQKSEYFRKRYERLKALKQLEKLKKLGGKNAKNNK